MSDVTVTTTKRTIGDELYDTATEAVKRIKPDVVDAAVERVVDLCRAAASTGKFGICVSARDAERDYIDGIIEILTKKCGVDAKEHPTLNGTFVIEWNAI